MISSGTENDRASFCLDEALPGIAEPIVGVKTLATLREIPNSATTGGLFLRTGGCANPDGSDHADDLFDPVTGFRGVSRVDELNPATGFAWSRNDLGGTEFGIRHPNDDQDLFVTQLIVEVKKARSSGQRDELVRRFNPDDFDPAYRKAIETYFEQLSRRSAP